MSDYYNILNLEKSCSIEDIKKSYRKLAIKWHPDKNPNNKEVATKEFQKISEAYAVLSNPIKRREYDLTGKCNQNSNINAFDIFNEFCENIFNNNFFKKNGKLDNIVDSPEFEFFIYTFSSNKMVNNINSAGFFNKIAQNCKFINPTMSERLEEINQKIITKTNEINDKKNTKKKSKEQENEDNKEDNNKKSKEDNNIKNNKKSKNDILNLITVLSKNKKKGNSSNSSSITNLSSLSSDILLNKTPNIIIELNVNIEDVFNNVTKKIKIKRVRKDEEKNTYFQDEKFFLIPLYKRKIIYNDEGDFKPNYNHPGDVIFNINIKKNNYFRIDNNFNLVVHKKISISEFITGTVFYMRHLDNTILKITLHEGKNMNSVKKIRNEGLPKNKDGKSRGDLVIEFDIINNITMNIENTNFIKNFSSAINEEFSDTSIFSSKYDDNLDSKEYFIE